MRYSCVLRGGEGLDLAGRGVTGLAGGTVLGRRPRVTASGTVAGLGSVGLLHELSVDGPGGLEFLGRAAQFLCGLE